jgi:hypothetical protein
MSAIVTDFSVGAPLLCRRFDLPQISAVAGAYRNASHQRPGLPQLGISGRSICEG